MAIASASPSAGRQRALLSCMLSKLIHFCLLDTDGVTMRYPPQNDPRNGTIINTISAITHSILPSSQQPSPFVAGRIFMRQRERAPSPASRLN